MAYGAAGDPENLIQPNTLMPYTGMNSVQGGEPLGSMLPNISLPQMGGNGGVMTPALPVAQAPELPGMLPTMDVAPTANPWQTAARMLQGFRAGMAGQPNPVIEAEQKQQALDQRTQALKIQEKQFERQMRRDEESLQHQRDQFAITTALKMVDDPNEANREFAYRSLQQHGALAPEADPAKLARVGKVDYAQKRDEAIAFIESGIDPESFGDQYGFLPLKQYKQMYAENPLSLNAVRVKPLKEDEVIKSALLRWRAMPAEKIAADPQIQRNIAAAESLLGAGKMPDYGNAVNTALGEIPNPATPGFGWNPKTQQIPQDVLIEAGKKAQYGSGPPTIDRDIAEIADLDRKLQNPKSPEDFKANQAKRDAKIEEFRSKQRAKMELQRWSRADIEATLRGQGLKPGTPEWNTAYANMAQQTAIPPGGSVIGAGNIAAGLGPTGQGTGLSPAPPLASAPLGASELSRYVNRKTLQPPPPGMTAPQIQASGEYVAVPEGALAGVRQLNTVANSFDAAEKIIKKRSDLFPESKDNVILDRANVLYAQGKWALGSKTDPDIGTIESLHVALPTLVKAFGDTGNIAVAERIQAAMGAGFSASTRENALARIKSLRALTNAGATAMGFPNIIKDTTGPAVKAERIKQLIRDGKSDADIKGILKTEGFQ